MIQCKALVDVKKLEVSTGWSKLLKSVTFNVLPGELCAIVGPSGAGKSVLFETLLGYRACSGGVMQCTNGEIAYVPQKDDLHESLTPNQVLFVSAKLRNIQGDVQALVQKVLQSLELDQYQNESIVKLSGGQKKRVSIALELLSSPELLILDEPCAGLDPHLEEQQMLNFSIMAQKGQGIILSTHRTHNLDYCNSLLVVKEGYSIFFGTPEQTREYFKVSELSGIYSQIKKMPAETWALKFGEHSSFMSRVPLDTAAQPEPEPSSHKPTVGLIQSADDILSRLKEESKSNG